ncbi:SDR family oxidoreductase [Thiomicrorhabdus aquaedulcis]|uniref:SDR family oxidoreductase n=1 Tax=Thiomicrorhabdus aquaedulcis TaxID=2211106 RepID=UPI000FDB0737|nr:SDR family oxidoreductase [Thiomicrorhabdus aquaedulcis]
MKNILVIGATSAIALAVIRRYADKHATLYLLGRNTERLQDIANDATVRGATAVHVATFNVNDFDAHQAVLNQVFDTLGTLDIALIAHGTLPNQIACQHDVALLLNEITTNAISTVALLSNLANRLEQQQSGTLAVITSVAGDRGRQSNYVYGAAKSMVSTFLQGLRNRLSPSGVNVLDIKPGFVDTPMTAQFKKGALWASPDQVAKAIVRAINQRKHTLYTPFFWAGIMLIIRNIPEFIFKKLKL